MTYPQPDPVAEMRRIRRLGRLLAFLTAMLLTVLVLYLYPLIRDRYFSVSGARAIAPRGDLMEYEKTTISIFKHASPSVAFITVDQTSAYENSQDSGSGIIWDDQGHVVTNYHVVQNGSAAHVILSDQTAYDAQLVGVDPDHDIAVLKINVPLTVRLIPIPLGSTGDLQVGQSVFAIGNPFGLDQTMTTGIISALNRTITGVAGNPIDDVIQTDAAINQGNSGGPLLDSAGRLIGINTAILSPPMPSPIPGRQPRSTGAWSGIGFAIPADTANRVVPQIIAKGRYQPARLGVLLDPSLQSLLPANMPGVPIGGLDPGSPAERAGLNAATQVPGRVRRGGYYTRILGDVITQINDKPVKSPSDIYSALDRISPGDTVNLTVWNNGEVRQLKIKTQ